MKFICQRLCFFFLISSLLQGSENSETGTDFTSRRTIEAIQRYHQAKIEFLTKFPPPYKCPQYVQTAIVKTKRIIEPCCAHIISGCSILCPIINTKAYKTPETFTPSLCEKCHRCIEITTNNCDYFYSCQWWDDAKETDTHAKDDNV